MRKYRLRITVRRERPRQNDFEELETYETVVAKTKYQAEKLILLRYWPYRVTFLGAEVTP